MVEHKEIKVGLIGFGIVGAGVAKLFYEHGNRLDRRLGTPLRLTRIADLDLTTDRGVKVPDGVLTDSAQDILDDPGIDIVIELIGGLEPALTFTTQALKAGKQVVTANKALLAHHGDAIFRLAEEKGGGLFFEGAVGGGIPLIRSIREGLAASKVHTISAILNGTSNYILTRMSQEGEPFDKVLAQAQTEGLAEADPTLDIEGIDAAHKLAILISLAFGGPLQFKNLQVEGINKVQAQDVTYAREFGYTIKLLAIAKRNGRTVEARVHPAMIPQDHVLAAVGGAFNAVHMTADPVGEVLLYGLGAGGAATSSAVVGDVIEAARNVLGGQSFRLPVLGEPGRLDRPVTLRPMAEHRTRYYLRMRALDQPGVLSAIAGALAKHDMSIESVIQKGRSEKSVPLVILTHQCREENLQKAMKELEGLDVLDDPPVFFRIEDEI